jgi:hypothetical protein
VDAGRTYLSPGSMTIGLGDGATVWATKVVAGDQRT